MSRVSASFAVSCLFIRKARVENLAYFVEFARSALRAQVVLQKSDIVSAEVDSPFQCLDFLIRDWQNYRPDWSMEQCSKQVCMHLNKFIDPNSPSIGSTAKSLQEMFRTISATALPHPGLFLARDEECLLVSLSAIQVVRMFSEVCTKPIKTLNSQRSAPPVVASGGRHSVTVSQ